MLPATALANLRVEIEAVHTPTISGAGTIDAAAVVRVLTTHKREIAACFEREVLHGMRPEGRLVVIWRIGAEGKPATVRLDRARSTVNNAEAESCVLRSSPRWRFPPPQGGDVTVQQVYLVHVADFSPYGMDQRPFAYFRPIEPPVPRRDTGFGHFEPCQVTSGGLKPDALKALLKARSAAISECLSHSTVDPEANGTADAGATLGNLFKVPGLDAFLRMPPSPVATWTVSPAGSSSDVNVTRGRVEQSEAETCLRGVLDSWSFPGGVDGGSAVRCSFLGR